MSESGSNWLPGLLFFTTVLMSVGLMAVVVLGPFLVERMVQPPVVLLLFGFDMTVRRTAIAGALGLIVTAFVFFLPAFLKKKKAPKETPINMTGA